MATVVAGLILLLVVYDFMYGLRAGFPVLNVHALMVAAIIWLVGFFCRRAF